MDIFKLSNTTKQSVYATTMALKKENDRVGHN